MTVHVDIANLPATRTDPVQPTRVRHLWRHNSKEYHAEYMSWNDACNRCHNPKNKQYPNYGGRGIEMCERWRNDFDAFMDDMGRRPNEFTIDRINNNQGYNPFNCRWAPIEIQNRNKRSNFWITYEGRTMVLQDWAKEVGHSWSVLFHRFNLGMSVEDILFSGSHRSEPKHGTISMYQSKNCRCDKCKEANRKYARENRLRFPSGSNEYRRQKYQGA